MDGDLPHGDAAPAASPQRFSLRCKGKKTFLQPQLVLPISGAAVKGGELSLQAGSSHLGGIHIIPNTGYEKQWGVRQISKNFSRESVG